MSTNYEKFVAANQALMDCFKAVPADQFSAMSLADQNEVCKSEANAVRNHLNAGHANFANILSERIAALDAASKQE